MGLTNNLASSYYREPDAKQPLETDSEGTSSALKHDDVCEVPQEAKNEL